MSRKPLSCQRCRLKKIKCNFEFPCQNCIKGQYECVEVKSDMRKKRPPANYVLNLEKRYASLLDVLKTFKGLKSEDRIGYVNNINLNEYSDELMVNDYSTNDMENDNNLSVYGPTSIFDHNLLSKKSVIASNERDIIVKMNKDPEIQECLKLFFRWQYPDHNMFIFREAFLSEFFRPKHHSVYCSKILVLSICAMGARMSDDDKIYSNSSNYYNEAKNLLLSTIHKPSITSLQSYLLLAFYDICNGSNASGWMLSGNAIRMGFDIGFQLHPDSWFLDDHNATKQDYNKEIDIEIKARVYWGSYMADHFIALLLGRPSLLKLNDATIPETIELPDLQWIDDYRYLNEAQRNAKNIRKISNVSSPLKNVIKLINISDNMLNDIFNKNNKMDNDLEIDMLSRLSKLNEYNEKIIDWRLNLPNDVRFDKKRLIEDADNPTSSCVRYYYYILVLCLNRPFIGLHDAAFPRAHTHPKKICLEAIEDLYLAINKFKSAHSLRKASIFIVYCSILSVSIILLLNNSKEILEKNAKLKFFLNVLKASSKTWKLAEKSFHSITSKLSNYEDIDFNIDDLEEEDIKQEAHTWSSQSVSETNNNHDHATNNVIEASPTPPTSTKIPRADSSTSLSNSLNNSNKSVISDSIEFFGGPPVLMTSDLFNQDWESLFPDYIFNEKN